jgi:hypothetical protein
VQRKNTTQLGQLLTFSKLVLPQLRDKMSQDISFETKNKSLHDETEPESMCVEEAQEETRGKFERSSTN